MGLFDQIEGFAGQKLHEALAGTRFGGLDGLLQHMSGQGLSQEVASWKDPQAENQPIGPDQVRKSVGVGELEQIAASLGVPAQAVTTVIAKILPHAAAQQAESGGLH